MVRDNLLVIVSGVSGAGKSVIMKRIMNNELISFTTRDRRPREVEGQDYIYITKEKFEELLNNDGLMEWTEYSGQYYGLTRQEYENKLSLEPAFFVADYRGMKQMKKIHSNCLTLFIDVDKENAISHMRERGETESFIQKRIATYEDEFMNACNYDHIITNRENELEETVEAVEDLIMDTVIGQLK